MLFDHGTQILNILVTGTLTYIALIGMLRLSGKRTLTQMNAFDFIITVAIGSTLATALLSKDTPLTEGLMGLATLILLQFVVSWISERFAGFNSLVKSEPRLLFYQGEFKHKAMQEERVGKAELLQAARKQGLLFLTQIEAIVLETNGEFSIIKTGPHSNASTLQQVKEE